MREAAIEKAFFEWAKEIGALCYKFVSPSHRGVPDRMVVMRGHCIFIEFKAPGETPSLLQLREINRLLDAGVWAGWVSSLEEAKNIVKRYL
jgi:hypothetical protein